MMTEFKSSITKENADSLLRFFYECYKHGVEDASKVCEDEKRRNYVGTMKSSHLFWKISNDYTLTWEEWRIDLLVYCRNLKRKENRIVRTFLYGIREYKNYDSLALRAAMEFYVNGVSDFNAYPLHDNLEYFLVTQDMYIWRRGFRQEPPLSILDIFETMHMLLFDRMHIDIEMKENKVKGYTGVFNPKAYNTFLTVMSLGVDSDEPDFKKK